MSLCQVRWSSRAGVARRSAERSLKAEPCPRTMKGMTTPIQRAIVLVGHGGLPKDLPPELVIRLKRLEAARRASGGAPSPEESDLNERIRRWPRTPDSDPYREGLERLGARLHLQLDGALFALAYNEFCAPTLEEAVADVVNAGANHIMILSSMLTPGGSHAEIEIPEAVRQLQTRYPAVSLHYAWPFDLDRVAGMLAEHLRQFHP